MGHTEGPRHLLRGRSRRRFAVIAFAALVIAGGAVLALVRTAHPQARDRDAGRAQSAPPPAPLPPVRLSPRLAALVARGNARARLLARLGLPVYCGAHHGREIALTFDDGPGPFTHLALRKLRASHERATFFDVGRSMRYFPGYLSRELRAGAVGDHTYTHADLAVLPRAAVYAEIERARAAIQRQSGRGVYLFRPPYGALDATVLRTARRLGLLTIMWTQDSGDSLGANYAAVIRTVERALRPGAIILMHENRGQTIRALTTLLPMLHRRHLRSVGLPELLATDPPSPAQLRRGQAACGRVRITAGSG